MRGGEGIEDSPPVNPDVQCGIARPFMVPATRKASRQETGTKTLNVVMDKPENIKLASVHRIQLTFSMQCIHFVLIRNQLFTCLQALHCIYTTFFPIVHVRIS